MIRVVTVWGPTAEWGDGSGPLAYFASIKGAAGYIRAERKDAIDRAADADPSFAAAAPEGHRRDFDAACEILGWPMNQVGYSIECQEWDTVEDASEFFSITDPIAHEEEDLFEALNER